MANVTETIPASEWAGRVKRSKSDVLHDRFSFACRTRLLPAFKTELMFAKEAMGRRWKFDFAWPEYMLAVEIEGLVMRQLYELPRPGAQRVLVVYGRHATALGIKEDMVKYNAAIELGWFVLRFEQDAIKSSVAIDTTVRALHARGWRP
jgi:hypothetical protein